MTQLLAGSKKIMCAKTYICEENTINNVIMCIEVRDGCPGQKAEHIDVMVLSGQGKAVLRGQRG
jgi:hypothetical protein